MTFTSYTATTYVDNTTPAIDASNLNKGETALALVVSQAQTHQTAATLDHPDSSVTTAKIADNAVTDAKVGNRTPDETVTAVTGGGNLSKCLNMLANIIKQISGGTHWYSAPSHSLSNVDGRVATVEAAYLTMGSAGGGSAGQKLWTGTSDPGGSASEGDWWAVG